MNTRTTPIRRLPLLAALPFALLSAACTTPAPQAVKEVRAQANPIDRPQVTITNFTPSLRCMDELMFRLGTRDVTLMMEEMRDATFKVPISARDMMTSAVSDMTRRSRAIRLSAFGGDQQNLLQLLQQAQKQTAFSVVPEYNIRGTISQFDEDVKRQSSSFGGVVQNLFGVNFGSESRFSVMGLDAAVVQTENFSLVPGVASKNTTVIAKRELSAGDGQARIKSANTVFSFATGRAEGVSQAARNMVELAAIELVGKLIRAPYWQCVGVPDANPDVQREMEDWFVAMDDAERVAFFKQRMRDRRWFDGALDGKPTPAYLAALAAYRTALGLPAQGAADLAFYKTVVTKEAPLGPLAALPRATAPSAAASAAAAAAAAPAAQPIQMFVAPSSADPKMAQVRVVGLAPGYVYCYAQDPDSKAIQRIYPNRFVADPRIEAGQALSVPGAGKFKVNMKNEFACLHAPTEVYNDLPPPLRWGDFDDVKAASFDEIRVRFAEASGHTVALARPAVPKPQ